MAWNIQGREGDTSPWQTRFNEPFAGHHVPFGVAFRFLLPKPLMKRLLKFGPNAVPGIFLGWCMHPGGKRTGEYLVAHWPDFQAQAIAAKRIPAYSVQEVVLD